METENVSIWWSFGRVWFCFGGSVVYETLETSSLDFLQLNNSAQTKPLEFWAGITHCTCWIFLPFLQPQVHRDELSKPGSQAQHWPLHAWVQPSMPARAGRHLAQEGNSSHIWHKAPLYLCASSAPCAGKALHTGHPPSARPSQPHQGDLTSPLRQRCPEDKIKA